MAESGPTSSYDVDSLRLYMQEINRFSLLTAEEERTLAKAMWYGREAAERIESGGKNPDLQVLVKEGQRARSRLIQCNYFLVINIAKKYVGQGFGLLDLIQEGNMGLIRAVDKFDYQRGTRFSTYATYWIRQHISRHVGTQRYAMRLPSHQAEALARYRRVEAEMAHDTHEAPTLEAIASRMEISLPTLSHLLQITQPSLSLETPVEAEDRPLLDTLEEADHLGVEDIVAAELLQEAVGEVLSMLSSRESRVIELRFGLRDGKPRTLEAIARRFGLTKERIRQIEGEALRKLRQCKHTDSLREYLA